MKRCAVAIAALVLLVGCGSDGTPSADERPPVPSRVILRGDHSFFDVAWLPNGWLVLNKIGATVFDNATTLWKAQSDGAELAQLPLPTDSHSCRRLQYMRPTTLPNHQLGFLRWCDVRGADRTVLSLMTYDVTSGKERPLMRKPLGYNPGQFTWNPAMTQGLFGVSSGICAGMGAMTRNGTTNLALSLLVGGRLYPVQEDLRIPGDGDCSVAIRADLPAWSPDGNRIAFVASPASIGTGGFARLDVPWNLYFVDPEGQHPVSARSGLVNPAGTAWSPDGRWLAYSGGMAGGGQGIWLYRVADGKLLHVASGSYAGMAWAPDGSAMAVIRNMKTTGDQLVNTEVRILDLSRVTRSATP